MPFTPETARKAQKASVESRRKQKDYPGRAQLTTNPENLFEELFYAAMGQGRWASLDRKSQLEALKRLMEYTVGRPRQMDKDEEDQPDSGFQVIADSEPNMDDNADN